MKKKKTWLWIMAVLAVIVITAVIMVKRFVMVTAGEVEVTAVSALNQGGWISDSQDGESTSGTIVSDVSQNIVVPEGKVISKVYVNAGDKVKIGDKLLSYDTTLLELDQELAEINTQVIGLELKSAQADLDKLNKMQPVAKSEQGEEGLELFQYEYQEIGSGEAGLDVRAGEMHASSDIVEEEAANSGIKEETVAAKGATTRGATTEGATTEVATTVTAATEGTVPTETEAIAEPELKEESLLEDTETELRPETGAEGTPETELKTDIDTLIEDDTSETGELLIDGEQQEGETEALSEGEMITEQETEAAGPVIVKFHIWWNHGDQPEQDWPEQVSFRFYENREANEPAFTKVMKKPAKQESGQTETTAQETEVQSVGEQDTGAQIAQDQNVGEQSAGEQSAGEQSTEQNTEQNTEQSAEQNTEQQAASLSEWRDLAFEWPGELKPLNQYVVSIFVENYIPIIQWNEAGKLYDVKMNYLKPEENPAAKLEPLSLIDDQTAIDGNYYKGTGTKENPYVFFCMEGAVIRSSFINWVFGFRDDGQTRIQKEDGSLREGYHIVLELREEDSITGAFIRTIGLDGTVEQEQGWPPNVYWVFTGDAGMVRYEDENPDDQREPDDGGSDYDPGWDDSEHYTAAELTLLKQSKELQLRKLKTDEQETAYKLKEYQKEIQRSTICSGVEGYVTSVGESDQDPDTYMVLKSSEGYYLKTTVNEMDLDTIKKGMQLQCNSWMSGENFMATITDITYYPASETNNGYGVNVNTSQYPVLALIDGYENASEYEDVNVTYLKDSQAAGESIYLQSAYIRSENGRSFVYKAGADGKLIKQYVRTGNNMSGYIEIKEGLTLEDQIAFPYAQNVKEGASVKTAEVSEE